MNAVRAAADGYGLPGGEERPEVPTDDVLAALTRLDEARAARALERDLTRAARARGASWGQIGRALGPASRSSAERRFVRLERDAASYRADRYPKRQRAKRARNRAGEAWCRDNAPRLRAAVWRLVALNDSWPQLARHADRLQLEDWHRTLDGPGLAARRSTDLPNGGRRD
jgi:hypothetical protein